MKKIFTPTAPVPAGHYSQATVHNDTVYISGLLPRLIGEQPNPCISFEDQVKLVFSHLNEILLASGSSRDRVLKISVFVTDIDNWSKFDGLFKEFFGDHKPARVVVPIKYLHFGFALELDAIAAI